MITDPEQLVADAHNDRMAARARDELDQHIGSARATLTQDGDEVRVLAVIAQTLIEAEDAMPRDRLASLLALALVRLAKAVRP